MFVKSRLGGKTSACDSGSWFYQVVGSSIAFSILKTGLLSFKPIYFDDLNIQRNKMVPEGRWWNHKDGYASNYQTPPKLQSHSHIQTQTCKTHTHTHTHIPTHPHKCSCYCPVISVPPKITQSKLCIASVEYSWASV